VLNRPEELTNANQANLVVAFNYGSARRNRRGRAAAAREVAEGKRDSRSDPTPIRSTISRCADIPIPT